MPNTYKITNIDANNIVTVDVTYNGQNRTFVLSGMPLDSRPNFEAALKAYCIAYLQGIQSANKPAPDSTVTGVVATTQTLP
jgi:hypothetical protein